MTRRSVTTIAPDPSRRVWLAMFAAAGVALGVFGLSQTAPAAPAVSGSAAIPVTVTTATPALSTESPSTEAPSTETLCQAALEAVATGRPVPVAAAACVRTFVLDADAPADAPLTVAHPAPEACEALLPSLAIGEPVLLGAAMPCVEAYVTAGPGQMATR